MYVLLIVASLATYEVPKPFRTLSDCLIHMERVDQNLRQMRGAILKGTCEHKA